MHRIASVDWKESSVRSMALPHPPCCFPGIASLRAGGCLGRASSHRLACGQTLIRFMGNDRPEGLVGRRYWGSGAHKAWVQIQLCARSQDCLRFGSWPYSAWGAARARAGASELLTGGPQADGFLIPTLCAAVLRLSTTTGCCSYLFPPLRRPYVLRDVY